ncbi:hypothetical protein PMAYCL1PPCAC_25984, partial [Pristionchus mayeri]
TNRSLRSIRKCGVVESIKLNSTKIKETGNVLEAVRPKRLHVVLVEEGQLHQIIDSSGRHKEELRLVQCVLHLETISDMENVHDGNICNHRSTGMNNSHEVDKFLRYNVVDFHFIRSL